MVPIAPSLGPPLGPPGQPASACGPSGRRLSVRLNAGGKITGWPGIVAIQADGMTHRLG